MATKADILTNAFYELGEVPSDLTFSVLSTDPLIIAALALYDVFLAEMISAQPWKFASKVQALVISATPNPLPDDFQFAYDYPTDVERFNRVEVLSLRYRQIGELLLSNDENLSLIYTALVDELKFPSFFVTLMQSGMAAKLSMVITQREELFQIKSKEFSEQFVLARNRDSQIGPGEIILDDPIFRAHRFIGTV